MVVFDLPSISAAFCMLYIALIPTGVAFAVFIALTKPATSPLPTLKVAARAPPVRNRNVVQKIAKAIARDTRFFGYCIGFEYVEISMGRRQMC